MKTPRNILLLSILCATVASAQTKPQKEVHFEVFSIRPSPPGAGFGKIELTPNGYNARVNLWMLIMTAYASGPPEAFWGHTQTGGKIPDWAQGFNIYDVQGRVAPEDVEAWRNQGSKRELLQSALRAALKERCKLVIHEEHPIVPEYNLVIGKKGFKLKHSIPGSAPKGGIALDGGGKATWVGRDEEVTLHEATMDDLLFWLNRWCDRPIHDKTGLTGRYDFTLRKIDQPSRDFHEQIFNYPVNPLGLELKPTNGPGIILFIDHMEKPDAN